MGDYLKSLSSSQIEHLIKERIDEYMGKEFSYEVEGLTTPNVNTSGERISFNVEIKDNVENQ